MNLKVRYSEVRNFADVIEKDSLVIDEEINNILKDLDRLTTVWQGYDSEQFHEHATAYFTTMRNIPRAMRNINKSVGAALDSYRSSEEAFSSLLRGERERYPKKKAVPKFNSPYGPSSIAFERSGGVSSSKVSNPTTNNSKLDLKTMFDKPGFTSVPRGNAQTSKNFGTAGRTSAIKKPSSSVSSYSPSEVVSYAKNTGSNYEPRNLGLPIKKSNGLGISLNNQNVNRTFTFNDSTKS